MVGIQESLSIHSLFINDITGLFVEYVEIQKANSIMWKVYFSLTSETASRLFKSLHIGKRFSCVITLENLFQKYVNANIVNLIGISHIKADNNTIFHWLQNNMDFISKIRATDAILR